MNNQSPSFINQSSWIPRDQISSLTSAARSGDGVAAYRLACYYEAIELRKDEAIKFLRLALEHGYRPAKYNLGVILADSELPIQREEGIALLRQAAAEGSKEAAELIKLRKY